jgi:hypothetical protein
MKIPASVFYANFQGNIRHSAFIPKDEYYIVFEGMAINFVNFVLFMYRGLKKPEIREGGITWAFWAWKWKDIKSCKFENNSIVLYYTGKLLFYKYEETKKWSAKERQKAEVERVIERCALVRDYDNGV